MSLKLQQPPEPDPRPHPDPINDPGNEDPGSEIEPDLLKEPRKCPPDPDARPR